ncbi:MAG TPA: cell envelope integrity protein TolA [Hyphomicrobiaceae bacterium]|nr:cell envelope integrity protein TolA [Hyphomicrobiaceae bacterium]
MHFGLIISLCLHAAVLGWAVLNIQTLAPLHVAEPEPVAVDLVTPAEVTKLRLGSRTAKQLQAQPKESPRPDVAKKEASKPTPVATAPPPPAPEPPPPAKEEPKPEPPKVEPPKPEPPPKAEAAKAEPPKAEPAKDAVAEKLAALPPEPAAVPPQPALEEQQKLDEMLREQQRQAEEQKKLEEEKRQVEEEKRKLEEEKKKLEEETRKAEDKQRQEEEERKQAELKKKQEEEKRRKEAELKKKREEEKRRKEAEAKKKFDAEKISALLNKMPDKGAPRPSVPLEEQAKALNKGPVLGAPEGRDQQLSASELAILAQIIKSCVQSKWNVLGGGEAAQNTQVKLRLRFNPDGRLAAEPQIMNPQNTPYFLAVRDSAVRAVQACEPYSLPPAKYDFWKDIVLNFDPRDMF